MAWHKSILDRLTDTGLFAQVALVGGKVRATIDDTRFLDIHFDPRTRSYLYALIDLTLPYAGDKRLSGWDDYPHEGVEAFRLIASYPHHFQSRSAKGDWIFEESPMRGDLPSEVSVVLRTLCEHLG